MSTKKTRINGWFLTGDEIKSLRTSLDIAVTSLASLLGVHASTVFRWEKAGAQTAKIEPLQTSLLLLLAQESEKRNDAERILLGHQISAALATRGALFGMHTLLHLAFGPQSRN